LAIAITGCADSKTADDITATIQTHELGFPAIEAKTGPLVFINIAPDNRVQITNPRSEMGQQVITTVAQMI